MIAIAKRNIKLFFRDRASVFFSMFSVLIIIVLYVLFLGDLVTSGMEDFPNPNFLMNTWIMAGMLAVTSITTTMGAFGIMVEDRTRKIINDFYTTPLKRAKLAAGYILSSYAIGIIMSLLTLLVAEIFIVAKGGEWIDLLALIKLIGLIFLSVLSASSMVYFLTSFFKSQNAFSTASTIIGTLIGFLTGIYVPIGNLPAAIQTVIKIFPPSHAAVLMRQVMMEQPIAINFEGVPQEYIDSFKTMLGIEYQIGSHTVTITQSILVLLATAVLFYALSIWKLSIKHK